METERNNHGKIGEMPVLDDALTDFVMEAEVFLGLQINSEREFRDLFGEDPTTLAVCWQLLRREGLLPWGCKPVHLLWLMHWYKEYPRQTKMCKFCGCCPNTWIKWRDMMEDALGYLDVVRKQLG